MTLGEFFEVCANNPSIVIFYFVAVPLTAFLASIFGKNEGHLSPWKYLYSALVYLACVPGIFSITLSIYLFLFERHSIMDTNIYTQILPMFSMFATLILIWRNVKLDQIPGFDKLSGLLILITVILSLLWILDRTRIIAFTFIPFIYVVLILIVLFVLARLAWIKLLKQELKE
jgi:hypothetical protein